MAAPPLSFGHFPPRAGETGTVMQQRLAERSPFFYGWWILGAAGTANFARNAAASLTISVFIYPLFGGAWLESDADRGGCSGWWIGGDFYFADYWSDDRSGMVRVRC